MGLFSSIGGILGGVIGAPLGPLGIAVGSGLGGAVGGAVDSNQANKTAKGYYNNQMDFAREQFQFQQDYAKNAAQWRVEDAKKAGLHPMAALGISNPNFSPVSVPSSPGYDSGPNFDPMEFGQSLNYAATKAKDAKSQQAMTSLTLRGMELDNEYKQAQIDALKVDTLASSLASNQAFTSPASPKVNSDSSINTFHNFGDAPVNLYSTARVGDILLTVLNPDIADSLTESQFAHASATFAREMESQRNPQLFADAFKQLRSSEQKAVLDGRAVFEYIPGVGGYMLTYPRTLNTKHAVGGRLRY